MVPCELCVCPRLPVGDRRDDNKINFRLLGKDLVSFSEGISLWQPPLLGAALSFRTQTFEKKERKRLLSGTETWRPDVHCQVLRGSG